MGRGLFDAYLRKGVKPLKEIAEELIYMDTIQATKTEWLWYPYIPFGKITVIQGDPGEGKTTLILNIAAKLTLGILPQSQEKCEPMNVIYQTAEDGLSDTVKPRLLSAGAYCSRVIIINESERNISMSDKRLEAAIAHTHAKLVILDPLQAYLGAQVPLQDESTPIDSEGARFIIEEAMRDDPHPLFIACQGAVTDLASAILLEPRICDRMTCIWIGGNNYPDGGWEFNLCTDIHAANVLFSSRMPLWQIPMGAYKQFNVSLAELEAKIYPCGDIGRYLFTQMAELNDRLGSVPWPHGETWCLGDEGAICALLQDKERTDGIVTLPAPRVAPDGTYISCPDNRPIRVYQNMDVRLDLEDLFAKLQLCYGNRNGEFHADR